MSSSIQVETVDERRHTMTIRPFVKRKRCELIIFLIIVLKFLDTKCYEKTLRKIVRSQSKMVQRPFSDTNDLRWANNSQLIQQLFTHPGFAQMKSVIHKMQHPKMSTILSSVSDTGRTKTYSRKNMAMNSGVHPYELRLARNTFNDSSNTLRYNDNTPFFKDLNTLEQVNNSIPAEFPEIFIKFVPTSRFFPIIQEKPEQITEQESSTSEHSVSISGISDIKDDSSVLVKSIFTSKVNDNSSSKEIIAKKQIYSTVDNDPELEKADFLIEESPSPSQAYPFSYNTSAPPYACIFNYEVKADINTQEKFAKLNIEPSWIKATHFWNHIYESRYESLMRNPNWPPLRVILVPRTHVDTLWKQPFEKLHNNSVRFIISNIVKKLQFYSNLTFTWNEVSHLSQWWKSARQKSRSAVRRLVKEGRLEITTGAWVETDEATSHLFGIVHQLMEGHQWLKHHLNYSPKVAWLTNSVSHGPTLPYLLSASGISNLVLTNLHFAWQQYLTEYQYTDFVWIQNWDNDKMTPTNLNKALNRIGNERFPKHSVLSHFLQFNSAGIKACGPQSDICSKEFNFANTDNHLDINTFNVKEKSEKLLEQYSKTGTTSAHNVIVAPIGGPFSYELQSEFDFQYNNYKKIADFVNLNQDVYKAKIEFGTPKDYFDLIVSSQTSFPTLKGDFLNFADISDGSPAYWTGYFTSRPMFKMLLMRLQATLRTTEILFSFALNYNALKNLYLSKLFVRLLNAREVVARLQDRNAVSGTLTAATVRHAHGQIVNTALDCWHIQEVAASLLNSKPGRNTTYLEKYVYREGEFISSFKSIIPGDQIYIFNSLNHERTEVVELISRHPTIRILDHNKRDMIIQINPLWKYSSANVLKISRHFFKIIFVAVIPPLAFQLFKIKDTYDATHSASKLYCMACENEDDDSAPMFPFNVQPVQTGDIQLESYKHRLIFDEYTGFLKSVIEKSTNIEKQVFIDFGAFKSSHLNSGMFLFNTNASTPLEDILSQYRLKVNSKIVMIISGQITTEFITIYGKFIHHTIKIYNLMSSPISNVLKLETKIDYEISPKHRELEVFMSIQTDIGNGNPPEFFIDNNGFQYTLHTMNLSRRIESNVYPVTNMVFIQDQKERFSVVTDHAQGVTALQEGQLILIMDRRVLFDDRRGSKEGLADNSAAWHTHFILLESFSTLRTNNNNDESVSKMSLRLPSLSAIYLANTLNYNLDIYFIDTNKTRHCHYAFLPLIKTSFPCDVMVLNYRAVLNRGTPAKYTPNTALLTLHRQSFSCLIAHDSYTDCTGDSQFTLQKILRNTRAVYQTNLVGTTEGVPVSILNKANFPAMEITTLRIHF